MVKSVTSPPDKVFAASRLSHKVSQLTPELEGEDEEDEDDDEEELVDGFGASFPFQTIPFFRIILSSKEYSSPSETIIGRISYPAGDAIFME